MFPIILSSFRRVSIPYRLATNVLSRVPFILRNRRFQFLIGWLQTVPYKLLNAVVRKLFQFLIGWLQTHTGVFRLHKRTHRVSIPYRLATNIYRRGRYEPKKEKFQFLIGWLQTTKHLCLLVVIFLVSIPYRLATNDYGRKEKWPGCQKVSIPYRLATNTRLQRAGKIRGGVFQFLIGWLQTITAKESNVVITGKFQFLIGWLQTTS